MTKNYKYIIVEGQSKEQIEISVTKLLNLGWKCQGGISYDMMSPSGYTQAMVLEEDKNEESNEENILIL
jgi:hypothetical protein